MSRSKPVPITGDVLRWAIDESGYSREQIASYVEEAPETIDEWCSGTSQPNLTQLRAVARKLKRQLAMFLLPEPPRTSIPAVHFRHPVTDERESLNPVERRYLREAARMQRVLGWVREELGEGVHLPIVRIGSDSEAAGRTARRTLGITEQKQMRSRTYGAALNMWRQALENAGVLVFFYPLGDESCRGFSLWDERAPLISINTGWNIQARTFTLLHEYGHLVTRTNSVCVEGFGAIRSAATDADERWCERFAASTLMPWTFVERALRKRLGWQAGQRVQDIDSLGRVARYMGVSLRATAIRLIERGLASWELYDLIPATSEHKFGGGGGGGQTRDKIREESFGGLAKQLFSKAVQNDILTRADVQSYLDVPTEYVDMLARSEPQAQ